MSKIYYTGNARSQDQIVTLTNPQQDGSVTITINGTALYFEAWDATEIASEITQNGSDALSGLSATSDDEGNVIIEGSESITFVVTMSVQASVDVTSIVEGRAKKPQITLLSLPSTTTGGTWTLTVDGVTTSALASTITAASLQTAAEGLSSVGSGNVTVEKLSTTSFRLSFVGSKLGSTLAVSGSGNGLTGQAVATVEIIQHAGGNGQAVYMIISPTIAADTYGLEGSSPIQLRINGTTVASTVGLGGYHFAWSTDSGFAALATLQTQIRTALGNNDLDLYEVPGVALNSRAVFLVAKGTLVTGGTVPTIELYNPTGNRTFSIEPLNDIFAGETNEIFAIQYEDGETNTLTYDGTTDNAVLDTSGGNATAVRQLVADVLGVDLGDVEFAAIAIPHSITTLGGGSEYRNQQTLILMATGTIEQTDLLPFTSGDSSMTYTPIVTGSVSINQKQSVSISPAVGGTLIATFDGVTAGAGLAFPTTAANFKTHLETLSNIDSGDVIVTGGTGSASSPLVIEFAGAYAITNVPLLSINTASITGGTVSSSAAQVADAGATESQLIAIRGLADGGDFKLRLSTDQSAAIPSDVSASELETILLAMTSIGSGNIAVVAAGASSFIATYAGSKTFTPLPLFEVVENNLILADADNYVAYTQEATGPGHWRDPSNWSLLRTPETSDDVILENIPRDASISYGLIQRAEFTADATADLCTAAAHDFVAGQKVRLTTTSTLPAPLAIDTDYYIVAPNRIEGAFQLATTRGGSAIDITDTGTGVHTCGVRFNSLTHYMSAQAAVGLPRRRSSGTGALEALNRYLRFGLLGDRKILLGRGDGVGSGLLRLDHGDDKAIIVVLQTAGSSERDATTVNLLGTSDLTELQVNAGSVVGYCLFPDETGSLALLQVLDGECRVGDVTINSAIEVRQSQGAQLFGGRLKTADNEVVISIT